MPLELYGKLKVTFDEVELVQELDEFPLVEGLVLYHKLLYIHIFADSGRDVDILLVLLVLVDADVLTLGTPFLLADAQLRKIHFI